jgi:RNA polymerase sigma factor (sigma-70 family)
VLSQNASLTDDEARLVCDSLGGDPAALGVLRERHHQTLRIILLARGATVTEAEDTLADIWGDCVTEGEDRPALLEKFSGRCALKTWLATVATRRWIDVKRRQARCVNLSASDSDGNTPSNEDALERMAAVQPAAEDSALVELLRESLKAALARCGAEELVLLRLVYLHDVTQREMVRMLGWHESKVSRTLSQAMRQIERDTLREVKRRDPWLELTWQDFLDLCRTHHIGFVGL